MPEFNVHSAFQEDGPDDFKKKGNDAFKEQQWDLAIHNYTKAINLDPSQATFYSNRAACWSSKGDHASALADANMCIQQDPGFLKGYSRKGKALFDLTKWEEAEAAYKKGLEADPTHDGCLQGVSDTQKAQRQAQARGQAQSQRSALGMPQALKKVGAKLISVQSSWKFTVCLGALALVSALTGHAIPAWIAEVGGDAIPQWMYNSFSRSQASNSDVGAGTPPPSLLQRLKRGFMEIDGSWLSYMEAGGSGDTLLLLLHRTSLSAEGEFGGLLPDVLKRAERSPPFGGLQLLAPDRPCHGYSPCLATGGGKLGPHDSSWLAGVFSARPAIDHIICVASGRDAVHQALSISEKRRTASQMILVSPLAVASRPSSPAESSGLQFIQWIKERSGEMTVRAVADTALWSAVTTEETKNRKSLSSFTLAKGSTVTLLYLKGDREVNDLEYELGLKPQGITVKTRWSKAKAVTADSLMDELWELMAVHQPSEEPVEEEFDDTL